MKKLKYYKYITYAIIAFIFILLSYLFAYTVSYLMESLIGSSKITVHIVTFCTIFLLTYYIAVAVHELTHFIVFKINKIDMRGLIIGPFIFLKVNNKWRLKFKVTKIFFAGGIAIPDIDVIENNEGFNNFRSSFAKALIAAPIGSIIFNIAFLFITIVTKLVLHNKTLNGYMLIILISLSIITLMITLSSLMKNEIAIGDYQAYFLTKKNTNFVLINLYQYIMFSTNYTKVESRSYLIDSLDKYFKDCTLTHIVDLYLISSVDNILYDYLTGKIYTLPQSAKDYIDFSIENYALIYKSLKQKEVPSIFLHHIVLYLALDKETKHNATEFYSNISRIIKINTPILKYYDLRTNHLLRLQNNVDYLSDRTNIKTSSLYELLSLFEGYYDDEYYLYNKIYNM